jgi:hypothetical protein
MFLAGIASILAVWLMGGTAVYACSLPNPGQDGRWFVGGRQTPPNTPTGVVATLWNYNPIPVQKSSSFWIMLALQGQDAYGQTGWLKLGGSTAEYIFLEWKAFPGAPSINRWWLDCAANRWVDRPTCQPAAKYDYYVIYSTTTQKLSFWVNGWVTFTTPDPVSWTPDIVQVMGEIHEGHNTDPASLIGRDHSPGDNTNRINAELVAITYVGSGGWVSANLTRTPLPGLNTMNYQKIEDVPGQPPQNWFRIWDNRCSD